MVAQVGVQDQHDSDVTGLLAKRFYEAFPGGFPGSRAIGGSGSGGVGGRLLSAGCHREQHNRSQKQRNDLFAFHFYVPPDYFLFFILPTGIGPAG